MGQIDILKILKRYPDRWFTIETLNDYVEINRSSLNCSLKRMKGTSFIDFCMIKINGQGRHLYHYRLGTGKDFGKITDFKNAV